MWERIIVKDESLICSILDLSWLAMLYIAMFEVDDVGLYWAWMVMIIIAVNC